MVWCKQLAIAATAVALAPSSAPRQSLDASASRRGFMTELATGVGAVFGATTFMAQPAEADTYDDYLAAKAKKDKKKDKTRLEYGSKTVDVNSIDLDAAEKLGAKAADQKFGTSAARKKTIVAQEVKGKRALADDTKSLKALTKDPLVAPKIAGAEVDGTKEYISAEDRKKLNKQKVLSGEYAASLKL